MDFCVPDVHSQACKLICRALLLHYLSFIARALHCTSSLVLVAICLLPILLHFDVYLLFVLSKPKEELLED